MTMEYNYDVLAIILCTIVVLAAFAVMYEAHGINSRTKRRDRR